MSTTTLTRVSLGAAAIAGVFTLAACGSTPDAAAPATSAAPSASSSAPSASDSSSSDSAPAADSGGSPDAAETKKPAGPGNSTPRCTTDDLSVSLDAPKPATGAGGNSGQVELALTFKNTSSGDCALYGVPGVDLNGPDSKPYGSVYHLPRQDNGVDHNVVGPGKTATASITTLKADQGAGWTPTEVTTIPPGQTKALHADWPAGLAITRQDGATHPGTFVNGILADPA
ncbi:DUF4232 domain-containing protein [Amycolatopsis jiangsuensis]|uniref:DUF4232 domain-containing protein n=1 Tax=Amycolatopsis jiangsuensis TaxID=1181879 RepID=A0A840IZ36_9PSEU|nr:DUF4232 domain-containing protein [Amycolatopsis jiangsuensis]MBB4686953.1 hypothetical protein [Amycolatopsis jiangsuensis]